MAQQVTEYPPAKPARRFRILRAVAILLFVSAVMLILGLRKPEPPAVVIHTPTTPLTHKPWPDRWIPGSWGWMWRLRDAVFGPRTPVNIQARILRFSDPALFTAVKALPPPTLATNALRVWTLAAPDFENASAFVQAANGQKTDMFSPRVTTADGIIASVFSGTTIRLPGGSTDVGFRFQVLPLTHKHKTDVTLNINWTELLEHQPADAAINGPALHTNLWQTVRAQIPVGNGFLLIQSPGTNQPGVILLLSIGRK